MLLSSINNENGLFCKQSEFKMVELTGKQLIDNILSLPNAPKILDEINIKLSEEQKKREKFYEEITEQEKAEFINGEVIIHSPVMKEHNDSASSLHRLISLFTLKFKLGYVGFDKVMITLTRNDYEPDICFFSSKKSKNFKKGQCLFPAPDLVVEVLSKSTAKNDRKLKFKDYEAHEILEYWIIDPNKEVLEQYRLNKKKAYELILKSKDGRVESKAIKGFKIDIESIFDDEENLKEVEKIVKMKS